MDSTPSASPFSTPLPPPVLPPPSPAKPAAAKRWSPWFTFWVVTAVAMMALTIMGITLFFIGLAAFASSGFHI